MMIKREGVKMEIQLSIDLSEQEKQDLSRIFQCEENGLGDRLSHYCAASIEEYITMFLGKKVFRRGLDINEYRLYLLITKVFNNVIPDEQIVSLLFQTSATESRSLIRSVMSKYQYFLKDAINNTMRSVLAAATRREEDEKYTVSVNCQNIIEELNRRLALLDGSLNQITKKRNTVSTYEISLSAYARLREEIIHD
jgi:hypothetical protein